MDAKALDGRSIGRVTHNTVPINLQVSGNHSEAMKFLLLESRHVPVVLGVFMVPEAQPPNRLGWSLFCHAHYLKSAVPGREPGLLKTTEKVSTTGGPPPDPCSPLPSWADGFPLGI